MPYDVDVIILSLDRPAETLAAIRSAFDQIGVQPHVIVVDQGSSGATLDGLARELDGRANATLIRLGRNVGVAAGRNAASAAGSAPVIVALDNDAEFADRTALVHAVAAMTASPDLAAIGFRIVRHADGDDDRSSWGYPRPLLARAAERFDTATFVGAGHAIRRLAWEEVGGYDPTLFFAWEEYDFSLRAIAAGWRVRYCGEIVVRHKISAERRVGWSGPRWYFQVRNRLYVERKWGAARATLLPRAVAYMLRGALAGLLRPTLRAIADAAGMALPDRSCARLPLPARAYLARTDRSQRGGVVGRLRYQLFARPGG